MSPEKMMQNPVGIFHKKFLEPKSDKLKKSKSDYPDIYVANSWIFVKYDGFGLVSTFFGRFCADWYLMPSSSHQYDRSASKVCGSFVQRDQIWTK